MGVVSNKTMGVYMITLLLDGRGYVGSSVWCENRIVNHRRDLRKNRHPNRYLQAAFNKYGEEEFIFGVVERVFSKIWLRAREQAWILRTKAHSFNLSFDAWMSKDKVTVDERTHYRSSIHEYYAAPGNRERQSRLTKDGMTPEVCERLSVVQKERFNDPTKKAEFVAVHGSSKARLNHSLAAKKWTNDTTKNTKLIDWCTSEEKRKLTSITFKSWHSNPANLEARRLRAQKISISNKLISRPLVEKECPNCNVPFTVSYGNRSAVFCSKGCATSFRNRGVPKDKLAKLRVFWNPTGEQVTIVNLHQFCKQENLSYSGMCNAFLGRTASYKGWSSQPTGVLV